MNYVNIYPSGFAYWSFGIFAYHVYSAESFEVSNFINFFNILVAHKRPLIVRKIEIWQISSNPHQAIIAPNI